MLAFPLPLFWFSYISFINGKLLSFVTSLRLLLLIHTPATLDGSDTFGVWVKLQQTGCRCGQNNTSSRAQNWFPSSPHCWWWWHQSQHRRPYLPGSVFIKELWSPDSDSQFSIKHLPHNKSLRLNCARQNDSRMLRHLINIIQATQLPCSSCF